MNRWQKTNFVKVMLFLIFGYALIACWQISLAKASPMLIAKEKPTAVSQASFCGAIHQGFVKYGVKSGLAIEDALRLGQDATQKMLAELRAGRATDFMALESLGSLFDSSPNRMQGKYLQAAPLLAAGLGLDKERVAMAFSAGELRFLPYMQQQTHVIVIAQHLAGLTPARARKVQAVANARKIKISVLWVDSMDHPIADVDKEALKFLTEKSGGKFLSIQKETETCAVAI